MIEIPNDSNAQAQVEQDIARLEGCDGLSASEITDDDFRQVITRLRLVSNEGNYSHSRGVGEVATKLGLTNTQLRKSLAGCRVIDIGAGDGTFAGDVSKDKSTAVTAVELNQELCTSIPDKPNLRKIHGDGYDLSSCGLENGSFDAAFVTYSTNFWANSIKELEGSLL